MIGGRRSLQGRKPGDKRVRVERPHAPYFRYTGPGQLTAKEAASIPTTPGAKMIHKIRGIVLGRPLASEEEAGERLSKVKALAIFSSDAISSSAYATEEILRAFIIAGAALAAFTYAIPVSIAIALLLGVVAFSYRQVCLAYPNGGGSYSVSKANLGRLASLVAASALLIDYNLTVAVSTSSAVEQIASAVPALAPVSVAIGVLAIALMTIANLRGLREAGNIFAVPTYLFLGSAFLMIGLGLFRIVVLGETRAPSPEALAAVAGHDPDRRDPRPAARLLVGRRGADRHGGDRDRGPRVQATRVAQRGHDADRDGGRPRHPVRRDHVPRDALRDPPDRKGRRSSPRSRPRSSAAIRSASTCSRPSRHSCCSSPRTRRSTPFRGWPRSSGRTASSPASSRSAATGWPSPAGSSRWG